MAELLVELFSEEIPARMQARGAEELKRLVAEGLASAGLDCTTIEAHATPRRLAVMADGLPLTQPDRVEERKGPRVDAPAAAIEGFTRSVGLSLDQCERRATPKGEAWFATLRHAGRPADQVLIEIVGKAIGSLTWPKSMRWGESPFRWVRPLHHILVLFDGQPLIGEYEPDPQRRFTFSAMVHGHRFLAPDAFPVTSVAEYRERLHGAYVVLDRGERKARILERARALAASEGLRLRDDPGLVDEVCGLVEWPVVLMGRIDDAFMSVPPEVLTTAMRTHQRYFSIEGDDGSLAPRFIVVANTETVDGGKAVIGGNERVLRARLSDAKFFWDQDRKTRLDDRLPALRDIVFHARLGSMADKATRLEVLAGAIAGHIAGAAADHSSRAARLCKADLLTEMVGEFPELQGVMGRYYALAQGDDGAVAQAIGEHYAPLGPGDACPTAPASVAVALADKIDTLVGFFSIGEKPTGSRDPYALRRAALGIIRLIVENGVRLPLADVFARAGDAYGDALDGGNGAEDDATPIAATVGDGAASVSAELLAFVADRLKVALREKGVRHDLIDAVFAVGNEDDLVRLLARVAALEGFLGTDDGANLLVAYRRAANIVRIEEKRDGVAHDAPVDPGRFVLDEERTLDFALDRAREAASRRLGDEDFAGAMAALAALRPPIDAFFDEVTVNADDPDLRANRLALLAAITATLNRVADFARIEG